MTEEKGKALVEKPAAPLTVKQWLQSEQFKDAVKQALPMHMTPERFVRVALTALLKTPKLAQCTQESVFKAMLDLSSLGLEPDGRRAHLIPYGNEAKLIIDYKGLIELSKRSGEVENWRAEIVCENDGFSWEDGKVRHSIDWKHPRGKPYAVYSHVKNKNGVEDFEVMTIEEVEAVRKRSKASSSGPWVTDFNEMAKKTVIRRHSKRLTLSPELTDALEKDFDRFEDIPQQAPVAMPKALSAKNEDVQEPEPQGEKTSKDVITQKQIKRLFAIAHKSGVTEEQLKDHLAQYEVEHVDEILKDDYEQICVWVEQQGVDNEQTPV
jgi:recombination protein RecT